MKINSANPLINIEKSFKNQLKNHSKNIEIRRQKTHFCRFFEIQKKKQVQNVPFKFKGRSVFSSGGYR